LVAMSLKCFYSSLTMRLNKLQRFPSNFFLNDPMIEVKARAHPSGAPGLNHKN